MAKKLELVLSPALSDLFSFEEKSVVIIDVLRATSTLAVALECGFESVKTVKEIDKALSLKDPETLIAGERNGEKIEGFDLGNSPFEIKTLASHPKHLVLTSTNGTKCVEIAVQKGAAEVLCGAMINVQALADYLNKSDRDIVLFCAAWQNKANLEDTFMAGCLADKLENIEISCDSALMALSLYQTQKHTANIFLPKAVHYKRLCTLGNKSDVEFCIQESLIHSVPLLSSYQDGISVFTKAD